MSAAVTARSRDLFSLVADQSSGGVSSAEALRGAVQQLITHAERLRAALA